MNLYTKTLTAFFIFLAIQTAAQEKRTYDSSYQPILGLSGQARFTYSFDKDGKRYDGWCTYKGNKYYIDETGSAHTGWIKIKGKWYYFHKRTAVMYKNCTVQNSKGIKYTFNSKGVCTNRK